MSRFESRIRGFQRLYLIERDGNKCSLCDVKGLPTRPDSRYDLSLLRRAKERGDAEKPLCVEHIDGNKGNDHRDNLRVSCQSCNMKEFYKLQRGSRPRSSHVEREGENPDATTRIKQSVDYQQGSPEMQVNDYAELEFRNYIIARIKIEGEVEKEDAIGSGAERAGVSINACRNYLIKMVSKEGPCIEIKLPSKTRVIRLKRKYLEETKD